MVRKPHEGKWGCWLQPGNAVFKATNTILEKKELVLLFGVAVSIESETELAIIARDSKVGLFPSGQIRCCMHFGGYFRSKCLSKQLFTLHVSVAKQPHVNVVYLLS